MKPDGVRGAGVLFLIGGCTSLLISTVLSFISIFLWAPAYLFGIPTGLFALHTGLLLLGKKAEGSGGHTGAGGMLSLNIINLDVIGAFCGWLAMVKLSQPDVRNYLRKPMNFPPPADPLQGRVQLDLHYHPALVLFTLATPEVRIDGNPMRKGWGHHSIEIDRGRHTVEVAFDYLFFTRLGLTTIEIEVAGGRVNDLFYRFNAPWIFASGVLEELQSSSGGPPHESPPGAPPGPTPPNDGMQPFSV